MNYFDLIAQRESCRKFDPARPVEKDKLVRCIDAARIAPSACNSQPWHYDVVTNPALLTALRPCMQSLGMNRFIDDCPALVVVSERAATLSEKTRTRFGAQRFAQTDLGLSVMQLCLAATEQGLSTCILGWLDEQAIKRCLSMGEEPQVRLVIAVGYAAEGTLRAKQRKPMEEIATFRE